VRRDRTITHRSIYYNIVLKVIVQLHLEYQGIGVGGRGGKTFNTDANKFAHKNNNIISLLQRIAIQYPNIMFLRNRNLYSNGFYENLGKDLYDDAPPPEYCKIPNWTLDCCCGDEEIIFIALLFGYLLANFFLWNSLLLKPMRLIAAAVHEFSHAAACWITGGKVDQIEVYNSEVHSIGGVKYYEGGKRCIVIPAGYIGTSFVGMTLVTLSGDRTAALISACIFLFALLVTLFFNRRKKIMIMMSIGFCALTVGFILMDRLLFDPLLQYLTLFYGVFIGCFSVYDLYDDLVVRLEEESDSIACHEIIPCCKPRIFGLITAVLALGSQGFGLYLALVWMTST